MKIGIIGSGVVGQTLGTKWLELGHEVAIGTRDPAKIDDKKMMATSLREWRAQTGNRGQIVSFQEAATFGDVLVNATGGSVSVEALRLAGADKVGGKILMDIANELDHGRGMPPARLGQRRALPGREDPGCVPEPQGRQNAEHDRRRRDGQPEGPRRRRSHGVRERQRRRCQSAGCRAAEGDGLD